MVDSSVQHIFHVRLVVELQEEESVGLSVEASPKPRKPVEAGSLSLRQEQGGMPLLQQDEALREGR